MSLQVKNFDKQTRYGWAIFIIGLLILVAFSSRKIMADGGHYSGTAHGNTTTGVQRDSAIPIGSCAQCHDGHGTNPQDFGLWDTNDNNLCFTCHSNSLRSYLGQTTYNGTGHEGSASTSGDRSVGLCVQCHNPHGAGDSNGVYPHMTASLEEDLCFTCHGTGSRPTDAQDLETDVSKTYAHNVTAFERKHDDDDESASTSINPNPTLSGTNRHVECADCHNPHGSQTSSRSAQSSNIAQKQLGSWGVKPTYSGTPWAAPTSYTVERFQDTATNYEYYLCLKCHSDWSWGNSAPYTVDGIQETNTAMEFSPANPSYHNVTGQSTSSVPTEDFVYGTSNPPAYVSPWGPNSAMACTDCHAADSSSSVRGAHGSTYSFMLKKRYKAQDGASDNTGTTGTDSDLCFDCHDWNTYGAGGSGTLTNFSDGSTNLHQVSNHQANGCGQCHSAVPHGYQRKHMIVYTTDGPPYFEAGSEGITSYTPANGGAYQKSNCATTGGCHT